MNETIERVVFLKRVDALSSLPTETLAALAELLHEVVLEPGETLFQTGDDGESMYLVVDGCIRIHQAGALLDRVLRHGLFGEIAVLDTGPRSASAVAEELTVLYRLDHEPFYELVGDRPDVLRSILRTTVGRLRARTTDVAELRRRLAALGSPQDDALSDPDAPPGATARSS